MSDEYKPLADRIRAVFRCHITQDNGIISAPEKLIDNTLVAGSEWLQHD